jgi:hypothetical protein
VTGVQTCALANLVCGKGIKIGTITTLLEIGIANGHQEFLFLRTLSNMSKPLMGAEP